MIVFCLWILQSAIRNSRISLCVRIRIASICYTRLHLHYHSRLHLHFLRSITLPFSTLDCTSITTLDYTSITTLDYTSVTTLDYTSIFYARLGHHLPLSFLTISSNPTANDLLAMRLSPSHLHYHPTLQQTMHISPYILSNNVLCPPKMAHT